MSGAASAQFVADDFNACTIDPVWNFVDPLADGATATLVNAYTPGAGLSLFVPGGAAHEIWDSAVSAPRLMQPVADVDLVAEVKFASALAVAAGQEGIVVRQNDSTWLRLEFYRDDLGLTRMAAIGGPTTVFADVGLAGNPAVPLYMRVERVGSSWTLSWSADGIAWTVGAGPFTYVMQPVEIGVYAGNRGLTPLAHTVEVDYFSNTAGAPAGEDSAVAPLDVTVVGGGLVSRDLDLASYSCGVTETLTAIDQPGWVFSSWSGDVTSIQNPLPVTMSGPSAITANFVAVPQYNLAITLVGGGSVSLDPAGGVYNAGTVVSVTAVDAPGWAFDSWSGDLAGTANPAILTMDGNKAVTAAFNAVAQFTLTTSIVPGGGGTIALDPAGGTYNIGTVVSVTAVPALGMVFDNWSGDLAGSTNPGTLVMDGAKSVTAGFLADVPRTLTVNVVGMGSVTANPDQPTYLTESLVELTAVPDSGWTFAGWSDDLSGSANPDTLMMNGDKTVTATFNAIPPVITSDDFSLCDLDPVWTVVDPYNDGGTAAVVNAYTDSARVAISVPGGTEHEIWNGFIGATHILQTAADVDFTIEAKFDSDLPGSFVQEGILIKESQTRWVRAEFFRDNLGAVRVAVDRGPAVLTHDVYLPANVTFPLWMRVTRSGDTFTQSWSQDGVNWNVAGSPFDYAMNVTGVGLFAGNRDVNAQAHTVLVDYISHTAGAPAGEDSAVAPLDVTVVGGGLVSRDLDQPSYGCGVTETLTAVDQPGWAFSSWSGDVASTQNPLPVTMSGPLAVTANFVAVPQYNLAVTLAGGGSVSLDPAGGVYNAGTVVNVTAVDAPGWAFAAWSGDLTGTADPTIVTMDGNKAVTATFNAVAQFDLTSSVNPGGAGTLTLDPPGGTYNSGTLVSAAAAPAIGMVFDGWTGDLTGSVNPATVVMDGPKTVTANFSVDVPRNLNLLVAGQGTVTANPDLPEYLTGSTVELTATPDPDWEFAGWSGDLSGSANPVTLTMNGHKTVTATFTVIPPVITEDDFNTCDLDPVWTVVDPRGDGGTATIVNAYTANAQVAISVPGGIDHEIWNGFIGATHILQPAPDIDFTIEAKFDSNLPGSFVQEGILIKESETKWVRAEFFRDNLGAVRVAVDRGPAQLTHDVYLPSNVTFPLWMRVTRSGDTFTQLWSQNGVTWNVAGTPFPYAMNVTAVGLFAGNRDVNAVAHTVLVDYISHNPGAPANEDAQRAPLAVNVVGSGQVVRDLSLASYACGQVVTLTAIDQPGWAFSSWSGDVASTQNPLPVTMAGPAAVTATFVAVPQFNLDLTIAGGGSVVLDPPGGIYNQGTVVTVTALDAPGWAFADWFGDLAGTVNPTALTMDGNKSVTATFTAVSQFTLTANVSPGGGGSVVLDPPGGTYNAGTQVTLTAQPALGNLFVGWTGDLTETQNPVTIVMDAAKTVTANFTTDVPRTVNVSVAGMGSVVADPAQPTYLTGSSVVLTAVPDPGWAFSGWSGDLSGMANPDTVLINTDKYITATFSEIPPAVLADDFNACELDPMWTVVDPFSDGGTAAIVNAYSDSARVAISVPGGTEHEIWNGVIGATHILQAAEDTDFTLEAKFDSDLQDVNAQMGILIKESATKWIRVEYYRAVDGSLHNLMTVGPANDVLNVTLWQGVVAPLYVRIVRSGDTFTQYWSDNHDDWYLTGTYPSYPMTVTGIGLYAGSRGQNAPAHTVLVDYLSNTADAPPAEDAERNDLTVTVVGQGAVGRFPDLLNYDCGAPVELTATPTLGWEFDSWSGDLVGSTNPATVVMDGPLNVTANFVATGATAVFANTAGVLGLSTTRTCEAGIPVEIMRNGAENMRAFSATVNLDGLALCDGLASIREGTYLNSQGATSFLVTDNLDGTYDVDATILGTPCGATAATGVLFTIDVTSTIADGTGSISLTGLDIRDCDGIPLPVAPGLPADVLVDSTPPANVTGVVATQALSGNPAGNSTAVGLAWTASVDGSAVQTVLFRKGFGGYPEYDDNGGAAPAVPASPAAEGWTLVASLPTATTTYSDLAGARDYWYYCLVSEDALGNRSTSLLTTGTLNYLLGDMSDGGVPMGDGDNRVDTTDVSLLGSSYGTIDGDALYVATLDVGPTHNQGVFGRPTTDNAIGFEDLILVSINYNLDATVPALPASLMALAAVPPAPADRNAVSLDFSALPAVGQTFGVDLAMFGDGTVQAMQVVLAWDDSVVEFVGHQGGPLLEAQGGPTVVLSGAVGVIDIGLIGVRESGISGAGVVATATFRVIGAGAPDLRIAAIDARSNVNANVPVNVDAVSGVGDGGLPLVSALNAAYPNPFNPMTTISFDLARAGHVRVSIFGVDGRLVRTLVDDNFVAGRHEQVWTGRDDTGRAVASGVYFYRMVGPEIEQTRRMLLVK